MPFTGPSDIEMIPLRNLDSLLIARIRVAEMPLPGSDVSTRSRRLRRNPSSHPPQSPCLACLRVSDTYAAAVMNRNPRSSGRRVYESVQQLGQSAVSHPTHRACLPSLCKASYGARIEMITTNHNGSFYFPERTRSLMRSPNCARSP